ncbi:MAG TPA: O-antigen ligase family protein [Candidatus Paceibacterota bacterium]
MQKTARFIANAALFLVPLFPLLVVNSYFFPFITGKAFFFRILVEVGFAAWLILCMYDAKYRPKVTPLFLGVTIFTVITLIADLFGVNPLRSLWSNFERMEGWMTIIHLWAFFVTAEGVFGSGEEGKRNWTRWLMAEVGVAFVVSMYGLLQLGGALPIHQGSTRIDASLGNAAYMAVYMLMNVGLVTYLCIARKVKLWSFRIRSNDLAVFWISTVAALVLVAAFAGANNHSEFWSAIHTFSGAHPGAIVAILLVIIAAALFPLQLLPLLFAFELFQTATRGTILGLIGGILLALFLYAVAGGKAATGHVVPKKRRYIAAGVIVLIIAVMGIFWGMRDSSFVQNNLVLQRLGSISWSEAQGQARNYIWPMALKGLADRPILGWGQENFNYVFNANYDPRMWNQEQWFDRAHSVFLDWLVASGILGFIAYIALYVLCIRVIWKSSHTISEKSVLTGLITGYAIHNIFVFDNLASYVLFFAVLAFVNSFRPGRHISWLGTNSVDRDVINFVGVPATVIVLALVIWGFQIRPIQANKSLIGGLANCYSASPTTEAWEKALAVNTYVANQEIREQLYSCADRVVTSAQTSDSAKQALFGLAAKAVEAQVKATPFADARTYSLGGSFFSVANQFSLAVPMLEYARSLSPGKQSIDIELAADYINTRTPEKAIAILEADYKAVPAHERVKSNLALAYIAAKRNSDALKLYNGDASQLESETFAQAYLISGQTQQAIAAYKKLYAGDKSNINIAVTLARLLYTTGDRAGAIAVFRELQVAHPEYKDEIQKAIDEAQAAR